MRIARSTPKSGLIFVSRAIGVAEVALAFALEVEVALAVVVAEGVGVSVVGNTEVTVDVRLFAVERKVEAKLLVVRDSEVVLEVELISLRLPHSSTTLYFLFARFPHTPSFHRSIQLCVLTLLPLLFSPSSNQV